MYDKLTLFHTGSIPVTTSGYYQYYYYFAADPGEL